MIPGRRIMVPVLGILLGLVWHGGTAQAGWGSPLGKRQISDWPSLDMQLGVKGSASGGDLRLYRVLANSIDVLKPVVPIPMSATAFQLETSHTIHVSSGTHISGSHEMIPNVVAAIIADLDNDGLDDVLVPTPSPGRPFRYLKGRSDGDFDDVTRTRIATTQAVDAYGIVMWDANHDGHPDILAAPQRVLSDGIPFDLATPPHDLLLYINDGEGRFFDIQALPSTTPFANTLFLFDTDNELGAEVWISEDYGYNEYKDVILKATSDTTGFSIENIITTLIPDDVDRHGMGLDITVPAPGHAPRVYHTSIGPSIVHEYDVTTNQYTVVPGGAGTETPFDRNAYRTKWAPIFADLDLDGITDLIVPGFGVNSQVIGLPDAMAEGLLVYRGNDAGEYTLHPDSHNFLKIELIRALEPIDPDGDGRVDFIAWPRHGDPFLLANLLDPVGHGLSIELKPSVAIPRASGGSVVVRCGDQEWNRFLKDCAMAQGCFRGWVHVGTGTCDEPVDITVNWPSGYIQSVSNVELDQQIQIVEPEWLMLSETDATTSTLQIAPVEGPSGEPGCSSESVTIELTTESSTQTFDAPCEATSGFHIATFERPGTGPDQHFVVRIDVGGTPLPIRPRARGISADTSLNVWLEPPRPAQGFEGFVYIQGSGVDGAPLPNITVHGVLSQGESLLLENDLIQVPVEFGEEGTEVTIEIGDGPDLEASLGITQRGCSVISERTHMVSGWNDLMPFAMGEVHLELILEGEGCPSQASGIVEHIASDNGSPVFYHLDVVGPRLAFRFNSPPTVPFVVDLNENGLGIFHVDEHLLEPPETPEDLLDQLDLTTSSLVPVSSLIGDGSDVIPVAMLLQTQNGVTIGDPGMYDVSLQCGGGIHEVDVREYHLPATWIFRSLLKAGTETGNFTCELLIGETPTGISTIVQVIEPAIPPAISLDHSTVFIYRAGPVLNLIVQPRDSAGNLIGSGLNLDISGGEPLLIDQLRYVGRGWYASKYTHPVEAVLMHFTVLQDGAPLGLSHPYNYSPAGWKGPSGDWSIPYIPDPLELPSVESYRWNRIPPDDPEETETTQTSQAFRSGPIPSGCSQSGSHPTNLVWVILALLAFRATNSRRYKNRPS